MTRGSQVAVSPQREVSPDRVPPAVQRKAPLWQGRLMRWQALGLAICGSSVTVTGLALGAFRYFIPQQDVFSAYPHASWPLLLIFHVVPALFMFFFVGSIWRQHVIQHWRGRARRQSGLTLIVSLGIISLSGYALYFVGDETWLKLTRATHSAVGVLGIVFYLYHAIAGWIALGQSNGRRRGGVATPVRKA